MKPWLTFAILLLFCACAKAQEPACPHNPDGLGTARVLALDTSHGMEIGKQYGYTLPLAPKEVVLTFDDGPLPATTLRALKILGNNCTKATFFLIGRNAAKYPELVRQIAAAGHTVATHTQDHPLNMQKRLPEFGLAQLDKGIASVAAALEGSPHQSAPAPFFRFPGLMPTPAVRAALKERGLANVSIDIEGGDWFHHFSSDQVLERVMSQLDGDGRGVILLHDVQERTVDMLDGLMKRLKAGGYKVVHIVPASWPQTQQQQIASVGVSELMPAIFKTKKQAAAARRLGLRTAAVETMEGVEGVSVAARTDEEPNEYYLGPLPSVTLFSAPTKMRPEILLDELRLQNDEIAIHYQRPEPKPALAPHAPTAPQAAAAANPKSVFDHFMSTP